MITINDWQLNKEHWLDTDLALMTADDGWSERNKKNNIRIWQRSFADDKNDLFRWRLPRVAAPHTEVFDVFTNKMLDYHQYWTAEYSGGFRVQHVDENAQIIYQQFNPNVPFIAKRDLLYIQWSRQVDDKTIQTSFRSIVLDTMPVPAGFERIDWWGGRFPAFLMNQIMPNYLTHQFDSILQFFATGGTTSHDKLPDTKNTALRMKPFLTAA
jgi:hypothetical protein